MRTNTTTQVEQGGDDPARGGLIETGKSVRQTQSGEALSVPRFPVAKVAALGYTDMTAAGAKISSGEAELTPPGGNGNIALPERG